MNNFFLICLAVLLGATNQDFALLEPQSYDLPECVVLTHCVRQDWEVSDVEESFKKVVKAVENTPRTRIVEESDVYIHAEAKTKWRRYTDDLLLKALPDRGIIQIRSESRVGIGDNGVNKKRVDDLSYRLMTNQIN